MNSYVSKNKNGTYTLHNVTQDDLNHLKVLLEHCVPITEQTYNLYASMSLFIDKGVQIHSNNLLPFHFNNVIEDVNE